MISIAKSNYSKFLQIHEDSIMRFCQLPKKRKYVKSKFDAAVKKYFGSIISDFSSLLKASPKQLFELKLHFDKMNAVTKAEVLSSLHLVSLYDIFINKNCPLMDSGGNQYNSNSLAQLIDIKTCPYCNENTTYTFYYRNGNRYSRTYDWDHIIPKDKYPFLAMSYFNLVPACKVCNQLKLNKLINISPHLSFNPDNTYSFFVKGIHTDFISDASLIKLMLKVKNNENGKALKQVIEVTGLDARLATQIDLVKDILNKKRVYETSYWASLEKYVDATSLGKLKLFDLFFSIYFNADEYYKRPFSKLTSDLLKNKKN